MLRSGNAYSYNRPFDGSHNVEVALSENEFDTPDIKCKSIELFLYHRAMQIYLWSF